LLLIISVIIVLKQFPNPLVTVGNSLPLIIKIIGGMLVFGWIWSLTPKIAHEETVIEGFKRTYKRLPKDKAERLLILGSCVVNGLSQELIYRGFVIFYLTTVFPVVPFYIAIVVSSVLFSLRKIYYGWRTILSDMYFGLVMAGFYMVTGSIYLTIGVAIYLILAFWQPEYWVR